MELQQLYCIHLCPNGLYLELSKVENLIEQNKDVKKSLEIDLVNKKWKYSDNYGPVEQDWADIGKNLSWDKYFIRLVFDYTDFEQLKKAFSMASHFFSNHWD
jgi:hypothetical protein